MNAFAAPSCFARPRSAPRAVTLTLEEIAERASAWDRLARAAPSPNPFYTRHVVGAHEASGIGVAGLRVLAVEDGDDILALLPFRQGRFGARAAGWASHYTVEGTPLLAGREAASALLDGMAQLRPRCWLLPRLALDSPAGAAIRVEIARRAWPSAVIAPFERAVLAIHPGAEPYAGRLSRNRRKGLKRQESRLREMGALEHRIAETEPGVAEALDAFLALEASGWKGRRGTALALGPGTRALAHRLFAASGGPVGVRADRLLLDGRTIAVSLSLACAGTLYLHKTAYDEALRAQAPGLLLELAIMRSLHESGFEGLLDTCAEPGGVLDELYPDRLAMGDLLLSPGRLPAERFARVVAGEIRRRRMRAWLKDRAGALRGLAASVPARWGRSARPAAG